MQLLYRSDAKLFCISALLLVLNFFTSKAFAFQCNYARTQNLGKEIGFQGFRQSNNHFRAKNDKGIRYQSKKSFARMEIDVIESASIAIFDAQNWASQVVTNELTHLTPLSLGVLYFGGLLTSFSPCAMSMLPLTVSYIGGVEAMEGKDGDRSGRLLVSSTLFALGLASALSSLGLGATLLGKVYGQVSGPEDTILPAIASVIAILGGLTLLELLSFNIPSLETGDFSNLPKPLRAFTLGASSALISSPCSTPVLGSILGFLAVSQNPVLGLGLLFAYTIGYTTPIVLVGAASGVVSRNISPKSVSWVTPLTGSVLIFYGVYNLLSILFPDTI